MVFLGWLAQVLATLLVVVLITIPVRRLLGGQIGLPRTLIFSLLAYLAAAPLFVSMAREGAFVSAENALLSSAPALFALIILTFLWTVALEILALVVLEVIVPTGSVPTPLAALRGIRGWWRRSRRYLRLSWIAGTSGLGGALRTGPSDPGFGVALTKA